MRKKWPYLVSTFLFSTTRESCRNFVRIRRYSPLMVECNCQSNSSVDSEAASSKSRKMVVTHAKRNLNSVSTGIACHAREW